MDLPIGLEKLRWGMTKTEAEREYRLLAPETPLPPDQPASNQMAKRIAPYNWKSCTFEVLFYFSEPSADQSPDKESLDEVNIFQQGSVPKSCADEVRADLFAHYGDADSHGLATTPTDDELVWLTEAAKYDKAHPDEVAKRYKGLDPLQRFLARASAPGPKARFISAAAPFGIRIFLYSPNGKPRITVN